MASIFTLLTTEDLKQLAGALRAGRLTPPYSPLAVRRYVAENLADQVAAELRLRDQNGMSAKILADCLDLLRDDRRQRPAPEDAIDLVWTGPEAPGIADRDTAVVVRELFQSARESVLVAGYAVRQGKSLFQVLAQRMDESPRLNVQMFLDIQRPWGDFSSATELTRRFTSRFKQQEWPGKRLPRVYYDPRSLEIESSRRASLHAKCVVIDKSRAFISSANFTEAAHSKNIEAGVLLNFPEIAKRLSDHFESLASAGIMRLAPIS